MESSIITKCRVSISGMLKYLGVSRSGYRAFIRHKPSASQQWKDVIKQKIRKIYDKSMQNYGAPKITAELRKDGEIISERTVGKYMREMSIRAQWSRPWISTTKDSEFSEKLHNVLNEQFNHDRPNRRLVYEYYLYLDLRQLCLPYQHHGSVLPKDYRMNPLRQYGGLLRTRHCKKGKNPSKY